MHCRKEPEVKFIKHILARFSHSLEPYVHVAYCSAVYIEAHGWYAYAAGGLGLVVLVSIVFHE